MNADTNDLRAIAATAHAISVDPVTDPVDVRRQQRRLADLVAQLADIVAAELHKPPTNKKEEIFFLPDGSVFRPDKP